MEPSEYAGLLRLTVQRVRGTARAAGVVWLILVAVLALPWVQPWRDDQWVGVGRWAAVVFVPAAVVLLGSFAYHWVREAIGRYRLRPTVVWNEGRWWFRIRPRGIEGAASVRCKVIDEDDATAVHEFAQMGDDIIDPFPDMFDVAGMKAGRTQPWGRYEVTWEVFRRGKRKGRATVAFEWHVVVLRG